MPTKTLTEEERRQVEMEARMGRLFGIPLKKWSSGKSCLSCGVALMWVTYKGCPAYCTDCAEEKGVTQRLNVRDAE